MRPNFKKPHHIASWHLRCIRHRRHRYCSDLFDLVISCLDLFIFVAILKCRMVPGQHLRDGSQEVFRIRVMNIAKCNSIPQSVSRYWVPQEHVVVNYMTTWVCRVQYVCVSLQVYSRVKFGYTYFRDLSGHVSSCNSEDVMAIYRRDSLQDWLKHQGTFPWQICNVTTLPQSTQMCFF